MTILTKNSITVTTLVDLEKAFEFDERYIDIAEREIFFDIIRNDERFIALMKQPKKNNTFGVLTNSQNWTLHGA
jgi:hypothetical protein